VETDELGVRGQGVLCRTARFLASAHFGSSALFSAARGHASTAQLSGRYTGGTERLRARTARMVLWIPARKVGTDGGTTARVQQVNLL